MRYFSVLSVVAMLCFSNVSQAGPILKFLGLQCRGCQSTQSLQTYQPVQHYAPAPKVQYPPQGELIPTKPIPATSFPVVQASLQAAYYPPKTVTLQGSVSFGSLSSSFGGCPNGRCSQR